MGYTTSVRNAPRTCFNGVENWQLQWYASNHLYLNANSAPRLIKLVTFVDFDKAGSNPVVINVANVLYLQYNRAKSFNIDTGEQKDAVTVTRRTPGPSKLIAGLYERDYLNRTNFRSANVTLIIQVCKRVNGTSPTDPDYMLISIGNGKSLCRSKSKRNRGGLVTSLNVPTTQSTFTKKTRSRSHLRNRQKVKSLTTQKSTKLISKEHAAAKRHKAKAMWSCHALHSSCNRHSDCCNNLKCIGKTSSAKGACKS
jgi:hypothetical protein